LDVFIGTMSDAVELLVLRFATALKSLNPFKPLNAVANTS